MSDHWAVLKAAVVALVVAALIWIWAEGESLSTRQTEAIELRLPSEPSNDLVIRPADPAWNGTIRVRLEGSVRGVDKAVDALGKQVRLAAALEGMPTTPVTRFPLNLREVISRLPALADSAGVVAEVKPAEILVTAERMVTRQLPVRVELARSVPLDGDPVVTPATIEVRMSDAAADGGGANGLPAGSAAVVTVPDSELARAKADGPLTITLPVRLPAAVGEGAVAKPETVVVSLRVKQAIDSVKLPTVPVWFSLPPTEDGSKWTVEIVDKFLTDVTVSGSSEDVQRVRNGQLPVKAVVEFTSDELERAATDKGGAGIAKQATFGGLPPGVAAEVGSATVRVRVTRRQP